ncbi:MAG: hypothetical protein ACI9J3_003367 [Parvicellaceae bacterium]|jgi:hypothetical protein
MNENHQALIDHCMDTATEMLIMNGEFHPFGAFIGETGRVHPMGIEIELKKIPNNGQIVKKLHTLAVTEKMAEYVVCYEVSLQLEKNKDPQDAICAECSNKSVPKIYLPYSKSIDDNQEELVEFDEKFAVK